jgi:toluene monooxygenase system ferredoxin subunit
MLRVRLCSVAELPAAKLAEFSIPGVRWPVLAGVFADEIIATAGVCPHEDVGLAEGELCGERLTCPGHSYQFNIRTGECLHDADLNLRRYAATIVGNEVWIDLL